ncbi:MAG: Na+/H+ antiporter NhaC family protein [Gammaproteobacteria bacterium]|nr:Na+/H+ antiporter NhaC family protein [Gammaproteobacteria bacterium]MDG2119404.1 Na+/H+ antiporter NhaC family protein [Gammaproteobacteria bacterium]
MYEANWLSILPPVLSIFLAILSRQVIFSLGFGIWMGYCIYESTNPLTGAALALDGIIGVFSDAGDTRVILFTLLVGALIATIEVTGGVRGFISLLQRNKWVSNGRQAQWLAYFTGIFIFIESNITLLVAGAVSRPLFREYKLSAEKLAYIIDSTSAPVCVLLPFNAWGAVIIGLLMGVNIENPIETFIGAIAFNFYPIAVLIVCAFAILRNVDIGPMRAAQSRARDLSQVAPEVETKGVEEEVSDKNSKGAAIFMLGPIIVLVICMPLFLLLTGNGSITEGSGSTSVLWAVMSALSFSWALTLINRVASVATLKRAFLTGTSDLLPVATTLLLALALGDVANLLGTGPYIAQLARETLPLISLVPLMFLISSFIAFSIGSSWGTFAIMIPIGLNIALALDASTSLFLAAVLSGAVFGDHASPISDTTVVASMASGSDHISHVRTQLPYALISGGIATIGFLVTGMIVL